MISLDEQKGSHKSRMRDLETKARTLEDREKTVREEERNYVSEIAATSEERNQNFKDLAAKGETQ
jgi:hypothetical protein